MRTENEIRMISVKRDDWKARGSTSERNPIGKEAMSMSRKSHSRTVSLRQVFPSSQIVGADDIVCDCCLANAEQHSNDWVFAAGLDGESDSARDTIDAINLGAKAILTEQFLPSSVPQCIVPDIREAYARLCQELAGNPSEKMLTIAVVGTHGKTTAALMVASMLKRIGNRVAYYTSLGASDGKESGLAAYSDAEANQIAQWLSTSAKNESPAAIIEMTDDMLRSHAASGIEFDVILFTGLRKSQRADSLQARGIENGMHRLSAQLKQHGIIVYNADDARLNRWIERHQPHSISYGLDAAADVRGKRLSSLPGEQSMMISAGTCVMPLTSLILGDHNARHMLGAAAVGYAFGLELFEIVQGIERLQKIPGRLQRVVYGSRCPVYVDSADQADRLAVALHALSKHGNPITCVAEVPDAATPEQLAAYGRVLERAASRVILTQSRLSTQLGQKAVWQVLDGCERPSAIQVVPNREAAIELAVRGARAGDQILLAGWGANRWTNCQTKMVRTDMECASAILASLPAERPEAVNVAQLPGLRLFGGAA
jgi:UDP-N-acetylmuramoyl-L-alanyl-D-glutamate--2,6-diaminopimelate ligase